MCSFYNGWWYLSFRPIFLITAGNSIKSDGMAALAAALKSNNTLETLDVTCASILHSNQLFKKKPQSFVLSGNDVRIDDAKTLIDSLKCNKALRTLRLGSTSIWCLAYPHGHHITYCCHFSSLSVCINIYTIQKVSLASSPSGRCLTCSK